MVLFSSEGNGIYMLQNLDNIGFNKLFFESIIIKKRVVSLNVSIHLLSADCASMVKLSALKGQCF